MFKICFKKKIYWYFFLQEKLYEFEQNKKNNLIFHGVVPEHPETADRWQLLYFQNFSCILIHFICSQYNCWENFSIQMLDLSKQDRFGNYENLTNSVGPDTFWPDTGYPADLWCRISVWRLLSGKLPDIRPDNRIVSISSIRPDSFNIRYPTG